MPLIVARYPFGYVCCWIQKRRNPIPGNGNIHQVQIINVPFNQIENLFILILACLSHGHEPTHASQGWANQ